MTHIESLKKRDYTLIVDKSGSMSAQDSKDGKTRWEIMQESTLALAYKCQELDSDGMTIYVFSDRFRRYEKVTANDISKIFAENRPAGGTNLTAVLQDALNHYFENKALGTTKPAGEIILVVTDGVPGDPMAVAETIVSASRRLESAEEIGISFIQVGTDAKATRFLKGLDDLLLSVGAKFDICDTITLEDMEEMTLTEVLVNAIAD